MFYRSCLCLALPSALLLASPALADVTADDVWANMQAQARATGGRLDATLSRTGETLTVDGVQIDWTLSEGIGRFTLTAPGYTMIEQGDGTVQIIYPTTQSYVLDMLVDGDRASIEVGLESAASVTTASGDPGDISYAAQMSSDMSGYVQFMPDDEVPIRFDFDIAGGSMDFSYRMTEGPLLTMTGQSTAAPATFNLQMAMDPDVTSVVSGEVGASNSQFEIRLPTDGFDLLDISAALRAGLLFDMTSVMDSNSYTTKVFLYGQPFSEEERWSGRTESRLALNADRLIYDLTGADTAMVMRGENNLHLPVDIAFEAAAASVHIDVPVSGRDTPQDFELRINAEGLRMGAGLWALFDPAKAIPRDPATFGIDLSGTVLNRVDLLNFRQFMGDVSQLPEPELMSLTLSRFIMTGAGTETTGSGAFSFDNSDMESFDGLPRPEGRAEFEASGIEGLIETLISVGAMTQDDAFGARMGLGMVTDMVGDDSYRSEVEINAEGHVIVNGQRLR